jgi:hypothetical protein
MSDTTPDTQPEEFFQGKIDSMFCWSGPAPETLGFSLARRTIYVAAQRIDDRFNSSGSVRLEYVRELPDYATPCEDFRQCLVAICLDVEQAQPQPIAGLTNLANGELVTGDNLPTFEPSR